MRGWSRGQERRVERGVNSLGRFGIKKRNSGHDLAREHRSNRAPKIGKKRPQYKPIPLSHLLADSHLPFLHEGFLHGCFRW